MKKALILIAIILFISVSFYKSPEDNYSLFDPLDHSEAIIKGETFAKALYCSTLSMEFEVQSISTKSAYELYLKEENVLSLLEIQQKLEGRLLNTFYLGSPSEDSVEFELASYEKRGSLVVATYIISYMGGPYLTPDKTPARFTIVLNFSKNENKGLLWKTIRKFMNMPIVSSVTGGVKNHYWKVSYYDYNFSQKRFFDYLLENGEKYLEDTEEELKRITAESLNNPSEKERIEYRKKVSDWVISRVAAQRKSVKNLN